MERASLARPKGRDLLFLLVLVLVLDLCAFFSAHCITKRVGLAALRLRRSQNRAFEHEDEDEHEDDYLAR